MISLDALVLERLNELIHKAYNLMDTFEAPGPNMIGFEGWVDTELFAEWRAQSLVLLKGIFGNDHQYSISFENDTNRPGMPSSVKSGIGILKAVREDVDGGYLVNVRQLIAAEVFTDFLAMAVELSEAGYKDPAASLRPLRRTIRANRESACYS